MYRFLSEATGLSEEQIEMECGECRLWPGCSLCAACNSLDGVH